MTTAPTPALELRNVTKDFEGPPSVRALDDVSLTINPGELLGIVGTSGSGKTSLLNIMGTLSRPTTGAVLIDGNDTASMSDRQITRLRADQIGFVFQHFNLLNHVDATSNVTDGLLYRGTPRSLRNQLAKRALERAGLSHRTNALPSTMSGGERQRVAIARALVGNPAIVLADEPTGNLDSTTSAEIVALLNRLNDDGTTIVIITHDNDLADQLPRQLTVTDGRIEDRGARPHLTRTTP